MLKSVMNDDEQAFSSVMVLIFQRLSLHVGSCAERLCMDDRGGRLVLGFGTRSGHSSLDNISS